LFNGKTKLGKFGISRLFAFIIHPNRISFDSWRGVPGKWKTKHGVDLNIAAGQFNR